MGDDEASRRRITHMNSRLIAPTHEESATWTGQLWQLDGDPAEHDFKFWLAAENQTERERDDAPRLASTTGIFS